MLVKIREAKDAKKVRRKKKLKFEDYKNYVDET